MLIKLDSRPVHTGTGGPRGGVGSSRSKGTDTFDDTQELTRLHKFNIRWPRASQLVLIQSVAAMATTQDPMRKCCHCKQAIMSEGKSGEG